MELVLMDDKGDKINASIRRTIIYKFDKDLKEGSIFSFHQFVVAANRGSYTLFGSYVDELNTFLASGVKSFQSIQAWLYSFFFYQQYVLLDRDCKLLFNKTCSEMFEAHEAKVALCFIWKGFNVVYV